MTRCVLTTNSESNSADWCGIYDVASVTLRRAELHKKGNEMSEFKPAPPDTYLQDATNQLIEAAQDKTKEFAAEAEKIVANLPVLANAIAAAVLGRKL